MNFKHFYPLLAVFAFSGACAQVGINTPQPQSTFDIVGNAASTSAKDGVTAPRITRQQLAAKVAGTYAAAQTGALVYVTDATTPTGTTPSLAQTTNISRAGYHYFDGTSWKQLNDPDNTSLSTNIYNSDGTLTANRIVSQSDKSLTFNGTIANAFSINRSTSANPILSVDAANDRVGIGTTVPRSRFDIVADNLGGGAPNDFSFTGYGTSKNPALFLASASGTVAAPANLLLNDIIGSVHFTPRVNGVFQTGSAIFSNYRGDGTNNSTDLGLYTSGVERIRIDPAGNLGIGNTTPTVKLDINSGGTSTTPVTAVKIVDGNQAVGKVLTSDANGLATWQTPSAQSSVNIYNTDGTLTGNRVVTQGANNLTFNGTTGNLIVQSNNNGAQRSYFSNTNTGANSRMDVAVAAGTGGVYLGVDNGSGIFGAGSKGYLDNRSGGRFAFGSTGVEQMTIAANGNVGIGNSSPSVKLDINSGGTSTTPVAAFKIVDGNQSAGKILTSDANGVATWQDPASTSSVNIYNSNGTLTGNRVVTQAANTLAFTSTATNGFSVDGATLSVDAANDRVGFGTTAPLAKTDAVGTTFGMRMAGGNWDNLWFNLTANGPSINASGAETGMNFNVGTNATGTYGDGQTLTTVATMRANGNMGIGTTNPLQRLHITSGGTSTAPVAAMRIEDGNQAAGKILTSDANGVATWQDPAATSSVNIYNSNGTLTGNRIVTQAANTLAFNSSVASGFSLTNTSGTAAVITSPANTNVIPSLRIGGASSTPAVGQGAWIGLNPNFSQGSYPIAVGAVYSTASAGEGSADFAVATSSGGNASVRMTVKNSGNVGIGTISPASTLHVATNDEGLINERFASGGGNWPTLVLRRSGSATLGTNAAVASGNGLGAIVFAGNTGSGYNTDYTGTSSSIRSNSTQAFSGTTMGSNMTFFTVANGTNTAAQRMILTHDGNVGIGTSTPTSLLSVNGSADKPGGGSWGTFSDRRVKKDINEFKDGLNVINQLKPVVYKYTEKSGYTDLNKEYVGFIAQEVEKAAPYMVNVMDDSAKSGLKDKRELDESALTKILVNAVKEQQKEIELLKTQVKELLELNKKK
ncbi:MULTISPECIES: tail fiber domain-containing protein [unclassified Chryseobacterium]|uniref:tail fiber domain-containing protein n=1 Tax=unclassified Chryseobacterium TaxID=2593645 RepID=UPI00226AAE6A|nr:MULTISPECIES: tail fiber domain-containing protein [unclassified Chryseobacterium]